MRPTVSVVVPVFNVAPYLKACLDSVVLQARDCILDVVLVDDGSTDDSVSLAEAYVERHRFMRLVRKANGGLGQARNVGARRATGDYLVFLDSDDVLPAGTYATMAKALDNPGIDFVTGNVVRLRGEAISASGAHQNSHAVSRTATHISEHHGLFWDTTAWNKMFRRRFWDSHELAFPEGVLYEDMELMTRCHLLARQVSVLHRTCYHWRVRTGWPPSITQCRTDLQNLDDRFRAILAIFETLQPYDTPELRKAYEHKVLSLDMPIYVRQYGRGDTPEYRDRLEQHVRRALQHCTTDAIDHVSSLERLKYWLMANGRADEVAGVNYCQNTHFDACPVTVRDGRALRTYPTLRADRTPVPLEFTDVTAELSPHTCVYDIRREGRSLRMDVHAFVPGISPEMSKAMVRRFYLKRRDSDRRIDLDAAPSHTRPASAMLQLLHFDGTWSRVTLRLPVDAYLGQLTDDASTDVWEAWVDCELDGIVWSDRVRRRDIEYMEREHYVDCGNYRVRACLSRDDRLQVRVEPVAAQAVDDAADLEAGTLRIALARQESTHAPSLVLHGDHGAVREWPLAQADPNGSWIVSGTQIAAAMEEAGLNRSALGIRVGSAVHRVAVPRAFARTWATSDGHLVRVAHDADGYLLATRGGGDCKIADLSLSAEGVLRLQIEPAHAEGALGSVCVELAHIDNGTRVPLRQVIGGDRPWFEVDLARVHRWSTVTPASIGDWRVVVRPEDAESAEYEPRPTSRVRNTFPLRRRTAGVSLSVRVDDAAQMMLRVATDWPEDASLHAKRRSLETRLYADLRRQTPTPSVLFMSWGGTSISDGPRRVYDMLARRAPDLSLTWAIQDPSVWTPDGVIRVLRGTREYFEALGRARYVVTNDLMPEHFRKREDCTCVRLGRGIPVKRLGADVTGVASLAAANVRRTADDAARWDVVVSGHPEASAVYRRAFGFQGRVLEAGQPRLDALFDATTIQTRERVRRLLGIDASNHLVLYAPTWRDHVFEGPNRYVMPRGLDLTRLLDALGGIWTLVLKNHPSVSDRTRGRLDARVINASAYPEMTDLYLAADVLVTDYSSAVFDFAVTGKPMLIFAPDLNEYREKTRGVYWNMEADLPGPVIESTDALIEHLRDLPGVRARWQERYDEVRRRFCAFEDGRATERVVEGIFAEWLNERKAA